MSYRNWTKVALQQSKATGAARIVLAAIACHANEKGKAWPTTGTIAMMAGITERGARKAIAELMRLGEIEGDRTGGRGKSNTYTLKIHPINPEQPFPFSENQEPINPEPPFLNPEPPFRKPGTTVPPFEEQLSPKTILAIWNQVEGITKARAMTKDRERSAKARIRESFFRDHWKEAIERIKASSFCRGQNDRGWKADIDWFLRPGTATKLIEGKYDNRHSPGKPTQPDFNNMSDEELANYAAG